VTPSTSRVIKSLQRRMLVLSREQPNMDDIERLTANVARVGLVIRVRWALVAVLAVFSIAAAMVYSLDKMVVGFVGSLFVPALALAFVLIYNTFFQLTYRRFANLAVFNQFQLLLDILTATVLVYYSGGVYTWFDAMYLLFIFEAALILPKRLQVAFLAAAAIACYGLVILLVYLHVWPTPAVPFMTGELQYNATYCAVRFLWGATMMAGASVVATVVVESYRREETVLDEDSLLDHETGLYNRAHFFRVASLELERATRHGKAVSVLLADIDGFDRFNQILGFETADQVIGEVAAELREASRELGAADDADLSTLFRFSGEEFAVLMPHEVSAREALRVAEPRAIRLAERMRTRAHLVRRGELRANVSVGVATYPDDGATIEDLIAAADRALASALAEGGDRALSSSADKAGKGAVASRRTVQHDAGDSEA
jgi:diguanylate cyclase (GGDEF)-like protein